MKPILVVGSANMDLVYRVHMLPEPGETMLASEYQTHPGGKGANQAVAAARLGANVSFCGSLGNDGFGDALSKSLSESGVKLDALARVDCASGNAAIFVAENGQNMILVAPNANSRVTAQQVEEASRSVNPDVTLAQCEIPIEAILAAGRTAKLFILNPAPAITLPEDIFPYCWLITPNETEAQALTGVLPADTQTCHRAARSLLERGVQNVVITLGSRGCFFANNERDAYFEAEHVNAIDTTAAGDAFSGAIAHFVAAGKTLEEAIGLAGKVAALSATREGAQPSLPTWDEVRLAFGL